jgi:biopolymer transport protein ExbD
VADQKEFDIDELETKLAQWKQAWDKRDDLIVAPEDGVRYEDVIVAMDIATAAGFSNLSMADGAAFL